MTDIAKKFISGTLRMARGTATVMGLAVMLAVVLGVGSTALAAVPGDPFRLGQVNLINTISVLGGNTNNPMMRIINNSEGSNATALDIQVKPNRPPMKVNSTTEVRNLNVDSLDGRNSSEFLQESTDRDDFIPARNYEVRVEVEGKGGGQFESELAECDPGDHVLSGGYTGKDTEDEVATSEPGTQDASGQQGWFVFYDDFGSASSFTVNALCADFPPLR